MRKNLLVMFLTIVGLLSLSGTVFADQQKLTRTPFDDLIQILLQIPGGTATISYTNNNNVNISGPTATPMGIFNVSVSSSDPNILYGNPVLTVTWNGAVCALTFTDGPLEPLGYEDGEIPVCSNFTVSPITYNDNNQMHYLSIAYHS